MFDILDVLITIIVLLIFVVPGYILRKLNLVKMSALGSMTAILLYVCQPALTLYVFTEKDAVIDPLALGSNMLITAALSGFLIISAFVIGRVFFLGRLHLEKKRIHLFAAVFSNSGFIGIPFVQSITNDRAAVVYAAIFVAVFNLLIWTLGVYIITGDIKAVNAKKIILNPPTLILLIALPMFFFPRINIFAMNDMVAKLPKYFGDMTMPLSMFIIGIRLGNIPLKSIFLNIEGYAAIALRQVAIPLLVFGLLYPFHVYGTFFGEGSAMIIPILFVMMCLPPAASMIAFSQRFNGDTDTATKVFLQGTILSIISMPVMLMMLNLL